MPDIEFVDAGPEPGSDEDLDARRPASDRTRRAVRIGAGAVLAVVAASTLLGLRHSGPTTAAAPPATTRATTPATAPAVVPADPGSRPAPARTRVDVTTCPTARVCGVQAVLPAAVADALRDRLPHLTDVTGSSLLVLRPTPALSSRRVIARAGTFDVAVEIHPATRFDHPRAAALDAGRKRLVYARTLTRGLTVSVSVSGPPAEAPTLAVVRALAADPRLLATA